MPIDEGLTKIAKLWGDVNNVSLQSKGQAANLAMKYLNIAYTFLSD